jgi:Leucine-rich repeat (LRR) protein
MDIVWIENGNLTSIPFVSDNVTVLRLCDNNITKIENLPNSLQTLNLYNNQITKIENLSSSLQGLNLSGNEITKIENLPSSLQELYLNDNPITELPLSLLELRNLKIFECYATELNEYYHHPLIERWLKRLEYRQMFSDKKVHNKVYSDGQNIHNSTIQKSLRNSLGNLLKDVNVKSLNKCKKYVIECNELEELVKRELLNYCDDTTEHSVYLVKFDEVFRYVISRIIKHHEHSELLEILNEEIKDTICKCFTGRMTRLVNVLNGFYDDITIQISSNEQISNIIIMLKERYEGEELVKQVRMAMEERSYDEETIDEWLGFLEE